jgi:hypothetical protein
MQTSPQAVGCRAHGHFFAHKKATELYRSVAFIGKGCSN